MTVNHTADLRTSKSGRSNQRTANPAASGRSGSDSLVTVERTLKIIEYLADAQDGLSISELARRLNVNKSIAFRIMASLEMLDYIYQNRETQHYCLTYKISNLGLRQMTSSRMLDQFQPILRGLAERTGELVRLAVVEGGRPIWVYASVGQRRQLQIDPVWGLDIIYHTHATGKAWLATLPDDQVEVVLGKEPLRRLTQFSITSRAELMQELKRIRVNGVAWSWEEQELGVSAVASPIIAKDSYAQAKCVGVVSVAAPISRAGRNEFETFASDVRATADRLAEIWPSRSMAEQ